MNAQEIISLCRSAFKRDDAAALRALIDAHPELKDRINDPIGPFGSPAVLCARSKAMLDVLLDAGADINVRSNWWAGGFGILDTAEPELAKYAIMRGAAVDVHSAARLGLFDTLKELVTRDPVLVHARGGDGQTPLHFASTVEIADYLLDHGAEIDARDVDHESTPAQYMIANRQEIVRRLIQRGCATDIFIAAALGDFDLARKHLAADPSCTGWRVNDDIFPKTNPHAGGTIYYWTLGWHVSPAEVARKFNHTELASFLLEHSSDATRLIDACYAHDPKAVEAILARNGRIADELSDADRRQIAYAARNNDTETVSLMLAAKFPIDARGQHGAPPLYWAAWHGNAGLVKQLLDHGAPLEVSGLEFPGSALSWAIHGSENGWWKEKGDYASTADALIGAGAKLPDKPGGTEVVRAILRQHGLV